MRHLIIFINLLFFNLVNFAQVEGAFPPFDALEPYKFLHDDGLADPSILAVVPSWDFTSSVDSLNIKPDVANDDIFVDPQPEFSADSMLFVR